jgi:hypothetical protein
MEILEGLLNYEKVLLLLGILLFLVLMVVLIILVVQKRQIKSLLAFFLVPILMIGYPSVKKIQYGNFLVEFNRQTTKAEQVSSDARELQELSETVEEIKRRSPTKTSTLMTIARAEAVLGDTAEALKFVNMALDRVPENMDAIELKNKIHSPAIRPEIRFEELRQDSASILNH